MLNGLNTLLNVIILKSVSRYSVSRVRIYFAIVINDSHCLLYFLEGYSVGAGHFRGQFTTEVVGGAPQHEQIGKVRIMVLSILSQKFIWIA